MWLASSAFVGRLMRVSTAARALSRSRRIELAISNRLLPRQLQVRRPRKWYMASGFYKASTLRVADPLWASILSGNILILLVQLGGVRTTDLLIHSKCQRFDTNRHHPPVAVADPFYFH